MQGGAKVKDNQGFPPVKEKCFSDSEYSNLQVNGNVPIVP